MESVLPGGWRELRRRNHKLAVEARRLLCEKLQVEPPCPEAMLGSMATIPLPERFQGAPARDKIDAEQLELYDRFGIEVPLARSGAPERRYFRVSAQIYNTLEEYEYLAASLKAI
jgi:isopenicillin-N epimerase